MTTIPATDGPELTLSALKLAGRWRVIYGFSEEGTTMQRWRAHSDTYAFGRDRAGLYYRDKTHAEQVVAEFAEKEAARGATT